MDAALAAFPGVTFNNIANASFLRSSAEELLFDYDYSVPLTRITSRSAEPEAPSPRAEDSDQSHAPLEVERANNVPLSNSSAASSLTENPTHLLIDAKAYPIGASENSASEFGVIFQDGHACIEEGLRHRINVLSVSGTHDKLTTGTRLYRDDGKEALLIFAET